MKGLSKLVGFIILGVNIIFIASYLLSAFSPYLDPSVYPVLSCAGLAFPIFLIINVCFILFWFLFYRRYIWFSLLALLITFGQIRTYIPVNIRSREVPADAIKILSYNVMGFAYQKHTASNPNAILEYIRDSGADIICLQEFMIGPAKHHMLLEDVNAVLTHYPYKNNVIIGTQQNKLACYSKYPIVSVRKLEYESLYNGSALYEILVNGDTLTVINNHLESNKLTIEDKAIYVDIIKSPEKEKVSSGLRLLVKKLAEASKLRSSQAKYIEKVIENVNTESLIVCGDFNDTPISYTHRIISQKLDDAFVKSGNGIGISYNQNRFYFRIDNILISKNLKAYNCTVDRSIKDSDHYPIWCYINKR